MSPYKSNDRVTDSNRANGKLKRTALDKNTVQNGKTNRSQRNLWIAWLYVKRVRLIRSPTVAEDRPVRKDPPRSVRGRRRFLPIRMDLGEKRASRNNRA